MKHHPSMTQLECAYTELKAENEQLQEQNKELFEVCLNARGAYQALKLVGADKELPGYDHCLEKLEKVLLIK